VLSDLSTEQDIAAASVQSEPAIPTTLAYATKGV